MVAVRSLLVLKLRREPPGVTSRAATSSATVPFNVSRTFVLHCSRNDWREGRRTGMVKRVFVQTSDLGEGVLVAVREAERLWDIAKAQNMV